MSQTRRLDGRLDMEELERVTDRIRDLRLLGLYFFLQVRLGQEGGWVSYRALAEDRKISIQSIQKFLGLLKDLGLIRLRSHGCKGTYLWFASGNAFSDSSASDEQLPHCDDPRPPAPYNYETSMGLNGETPEVSIRSKRWYLRYERLSREALVERHRSGSLGRARLVGLVATPGDVALIHRGNHFRADVSFWIAVLPYGEALGEVRLFEVADD